MIVIGFILGTILGSFVKALADRSLGKKSFWGRSYCLSCHHKLAWYDLFPIASYILLRGKCRYCHKKIGIEYLLVEIGMGILVGFLFWQTPFVIARSEATWQSVFQSSILLVDLLSKTFFITILAVLFLTDLKKMLIPDRVIKPAIVIALVSLIVVTIYKVSYLYYSLSQSMVGRLLLPPHSDYFQRHAIAAAQPLMWGIFMGILIGGFFYGLIIITRGKGMGGGDVKLGAFIGLMLGFPQALFALILAFLTGAVFSIGLIIFGKKHFGQTIPFGPFLVLGSLIMLYWGNQIVDWYLKLGS
ncbi:prepilin peptidase [Candidatus Daviesbacteria bacterium]|nr:prepilin peptidase [Candidatus Daviesbacteria bacterium]